MLAKFREEELHEAKTNNVHAANIIDFMNFSFSVSGENKTERSQKTRPGYAVNLRFIASI